LNFIKSLFPLTFKQYWFATAYFSLYMLSPFLNKLIKNINKNEFLLLNIISFVIFSVIHTFTNQDFYGNELIQLIMFYFYGAYLRKYCSTPTNKQKNYNKMFFVFSSLLIICSIITIDLLGLRVSAISRYSTYFLNRTSPLAILFSVCLFNIFSWGKPFSNKIINKIAGSVFGIYLLHDNAYIRKILWVNLLKVGNYVASDLFILHLLGSVALVFIICSIISLLRILLFEKLVFRCIDKPIIKLQYQFEKIFSKLKEINN